MTFTGLAVFDQTIEKSGNQTIMQSCFVTAK